MESKAFVRILSSVRGILESLGDDVISVDWSTLDGVLRVHVRGEREYEHLEFKKDRSCSSDFFDERWECKPTDGVVIAYLYKYREPEEFACDYDENENSPF